MAGEHQIGPGGRAYLMQEINQAFSRRNVQQTAEKLGDLASTGDYLEICNHLGFLDAIHGGNFRHYRSTMPIPAVNQALMTAAFRHALTAQPKPIPLRILIVSGTHEIITITGTETEVSVVLTRDDSERAAPRKRAARAH
jgi:hypothetical protein